MSDNSATSSEPGDQPRRTDGTEEPCPRRRRASHDDSRPAVIRFFVPLFLLAVVILLPWCFMFEGEPWHLWVYIAVVAISAIWAVARRLRKQEPAE